MPKFKPDNMIWSYSRLTSFDQCPYGWWKTYHYKDKGVSNIFSDYGTICHKIIEEQMFNKKNGITLMTNDEMRSKFQEMFYDMTWKFPTSDMKRNYLYEGLEYFSKWDSFINHDILKVEYPIDFSLKNKKCKCVIDLISKQNGSIYITDHKSSKPYENEELKQKYKQLYFYTIPVFNLLKKYPDVLCFNFLRKNKIVGESFNDSILMDIEEWFIQKVDEIRTCDNFEPRPDKFFCNNLCNHRFDCEHKEDRFQVGEGEFEGFV